MHGRFTLPHPLTTYFLARGTLLREAIIHSLCIPYPTTKPAREAAKKLVDDIANAVLTQIFVAQTAPDLSDGEMEVTLCASHLDNIWSHIHLPDHSPCGSRCPRSLPSHGEPPLGRPAGTTEKISEEDTLHIAIAFIPDL
jgi:hypothetical protein